MKWILLWVVVSLALTMFWPTSAMGGHGAIGASVIAAGCTFVGLILLAVLWTYGVSK
jgi:hypothetical protein